MKNNWSTADSALHLVEKVGLATYGCCVVPHCNRNCLILFYYCWKKKKKNDILLLIVEGWTTETIAGSAKTDSTVQRLDVVIATDFDGFWSFFCTFVVVLLFCTGLIYFDFGIVELNMHWRRNCRWTQRAPLFLAAYCFVKIRIDCQLIYSVRNSKFFLGEFRRILIVHFKCFNF